MQIKNFTFREFIESEIAIRYGIENIPTHFKTIYNLIYTVEQMQKIRDYLGCPIFITSGYRCPKLNKRVNGTSGSQHMFGMACDFICPDYKKGDLAKICSAILDSGVLYDQLILEDGWIHISFNKDKNRQQFIEE